MDRQQIEQLIEEKLREIRDILKYHEHKGPDGPNIHPRDLVNFKQEPIADVSGTAGGTYNGATQTLINDLVTAVNAILEVMRLTSQIKE